MMPSARLRQRGQAISEFLIVAVLLLIPLMLIIPVLAMVISQKQDVELGARYAAWEYTAWNHTQPSGPGATGTAKSAQILEQEIDARLLSQDAAPVVSDEGFTADLDPFAHFVASGAAVLENRSGEADDARYTRASIASHRPAGAVRASEAVIDGLDAIGRFELERDGVTESDVALELVDLTHIFNIDGTALDNFRLERRNALFTEAWTGGSRQRTEYLIGGLTPQQYFDNSGFRTMQRGFAQQPYGEELGPDVLKPGHADIEPLPEYRLGEVPPQ